MNIYEFAFDFEKEHWSYYKQRAEETDNNNLKKVFNDLASEEQKHAEIVERLSVRREANHVESNILPRAKKVLEKIATDLPESALPTEQVDIYKQALKMEKESYEFYRERAKQAELEFIKKAFDKLAEEEKKHENIMHNLVEFVNRPNTWLDDAEWYHLDEY